VIGREAKSGITIRFPFHFSFLTMAKSKKQQRPAPSSVAPKRTHQIEQEIVDVLNQRIAVESPARGYAPPLSQTMAFRALPISEVTLRGLESAKTPFTIMTAIQNSCIPHALAGRDILGAAKTGR
jgi:ATP-dependent RNA helicase DDX10/DBP4